MILYLHGFCSSPASAKTVALRERMAARGLAAALWCPQLPTHPQQAIALIEQQIQLCQHQEIKPTLIGSSLGGYYATCLAEKHDLRAVVVNPAVAGAVAFQAWLGEHHNFHSGERFVVTQDFVNQLLALALPALRHPHNFWLLCETGDELLDYRAAVAFYANARQSVLAGGNHSFTRWPDFLDEILVFAGLVSADAQ